ncbi:MAG TPA: cell division protein FtsQ/DivIB [Burkholderiales bacterium]|nr:cell division protein FtsQ/DivIB [Burkholderiales bacterium]
MSARLTLLAGIVSGMAVLALCFGALYWVLLPQHFPLTRIDLKGNLERTSKAQLEAALPRISGNFFAADLAEVRASVERLPWVRHVAVRRVWPGRLEISIEEHVALARWGTGDEMSALVNTHGERFAAKTDQALPLFIGPAGTQAEVARRYARFNEIVAPLGTRIERVALSARHAWQLRLANGLHLALGRDADLAENRLRRFVEVYPTVNNKNEYVDLRYPNGFAVRVPDLKS